VLFKLSNSEAKGITGVQIEASLKAQGTNQDQKPGISIADFQEILKTGKCNDALGDVLKRSTVQVGGYIIKTSADNNIEFFKGFGTNTKQERVSYDVNSFDHTLFETLNKIASKKIKPEKLPGTSPSKATVSVLNVNAYSRAVA
jgi:hypothetical protein